MFLFITRKTAVNVALCGSVAVVLAHVIALYLAGLDPVSTPIAALGETSGGVVHALGLAAFAPAFVALARLLRHRRDTWATRLTRTLLVVTALLVLVLAGRSVIALAPDPFADTLMWLVASSVGAAMGFALPMLRRRRHTAWLWTLACFVAWLALAPLAALAAPDLVGLHERVTGTLLVIWVAALALSLRTHPSD